MLRELNLDEGYLRDVVDTINWRCARLSHNQPDDISIVGNNPRNKFQFFQVQMEKYTIYHVRTESWINRIKGSLTGEYTYKWLFVYASIIMNVIQQHGCNLESQIDDVYALKQLIKKLSANPELIYENRQSRDHYNFVIKSAQLTDHIEHLEKELRSIYKARTLQTYMEDLASEAESLATQARHGLTRNIIGADKFRSLAMDSEANIKELADYGHIGISSFVKGQHSLPGFLVYLTDRSTCIQSHNQIHESSSAKYQKNVEALEQTCRALSQLKDGFITQDDFCEKFNYIFGNEIAVQSQLKKCIVFKDGVDSSYSGLYRLANFWCNRTGENNASLRQKLNELYYLYVQCCLLISYLEQSRDTLEKLAQQAGNWGQIFIAHQDPLRKLYLRALALSYGFASELNHYYKSYRDSIDELMEAVNDYSGEATYRKLFVEYINPTRTSQEKINNNMNREHCFGAQVFQIRDKLKHWASQEHLANSINELYSINQQINKLTSVFQRLGLDLNYYYRYVSQDEFSFQDSGFIEAYSEVEHSPSAASGGGIANPGGADVDVSGAAAHNNRPSVAISSIHDNYDVDKWDLHYARNFFPRQNGPSIDNSEIGSNQIGFIDVDDFEEDQKHRFLETLGLDYDRDYLVKMSNYSWQIIIGNYFNVIYRTLVDYATKSISDKSSRRTNNISEKFPNLVNTNGTLSSFENWLFKHGGSINSLLNNITDIINKNPSGPSQSGLETKLQKLGLVRNARQVMDFSISPIECQDCLVNPANFFNISSGNSFNIGGAKPLNILVYLRLLHDKNLNQSSETRRHEHLELYFEEILYIINETLSKVDNRPSPQQTQDDFDNIKNCYIKMLKDKAKWIRINRIQRYYWPMSDSINLKDCVDEACDDYIKCYGELYGKQKPSWQAVKASLKNDPYTLCHLMLDVYGKTGSYWSNNSLNLSLRVRMLEKINSELEKKGYGIDRSEQATQYVSREQSHKVIANYLRFHYPQQDRFINTMMRVVNNNLLKNGHKNGRQPDRQVTKAALVVYRTQNFLEACQRELADAVKCFLAEQQMIEQPNSSDNRQLQVPKNFTQENLVKDTPRTRQKLWRTFAASSSRIFSHSRTADILREQLEELSEPGSTNYSINS